MAVATAAADLLEAGQLDVDLIMLLEGEEETVSWKLCLSRAAAHLT
jgi:acetylornithine deacetylase/succinyl-diaminopimelate desuccinylase-like protein